ncbi:hypothetical protein [Desulfuromonas thiophila]|uniref:Uncharacterized protein n=1 Tax=Desulfuromonas thiophila TaxID=57664 RepID=A0A1G7BEJ7_9BACT|nr:hypothetical protein [Desulfuromonas thiophila]SDE25479.1 hypothetical protein SAMN05661003_1068 [Desulfuromonas thiophila]
MMRSRRPALQPRALLLFLLLPVLLLAALPLQAAPFSPEKLPPQLQPWSDWVLHQQPERVCPLLWNQSENRQCRWPTRLDMLVTATAAQFDLQLRLDQAGWQRLPGDARLWPQRVRCNDAPAPVLRHNDCPALWLPAGDYRISGQLNFDQRPQRLAVPPDCGLVQLQLDGRLVPQPRLEGDQLWLTTAGDVATQEQVQMQVLRKLSDDIPARLTTLIELQVAGPARELLSAPVLPEGFIPLDIDSPLPARLEPDGRLRLHLQAGQWQLRIEARHTGPADVFSRPPVEGPWPQQEIWVVESHPELRPIRISGAPAIDPQQTGLPAAWRQLPAFVLEPQQQLTLTGQKRGDDPPSADRLQLQRDLWLDFDGRGYSLRDRISGNLAGGSRLEAAPELLLGRVNSDQQDLFITRLQPDGPAGVELRQQTVQVLAESRLESGADGQLPALGWNFSAEALQVRLHLPPGWRLFDAIGADRVGPTWLRSWSLFDLFVVLMVSLGCSRLWGWRSGLLALLALALTYHETAAPRLLWLATLLPTALLRLVPAGRLRQLCQLARGATLLALLLVLLGFSSQQMRAALYPQLEPPAAAQRRMAGQQAESFDAALQSTAMPLSKQASSRVALAELAPAPLPRYAPELKSQTGPGLPRWSWRSAELSWNGPVQPQQQLRLLLIPPALNRLLLLAGLLLGALLFARLARPDGRQSGASNNPPEAAATTSAVPPALLVAVLLGLSVLMPAPLQADSFPSPQLLDELRQRLTAAPDCAPDCAALQQLDIELRDNLLRLRLQFSSVVASAVPLPGDMRSLQLLEAVDGQGRAVPLFRHEQNLWARLGNGISQLDLLLQVAEDAGSLDLDLAMPAGRVQLQLDGWQASGLRPGEGSRGPIALRRAATAPQQLQPAELPPFAEITRTLRLRHDWQIDSQLRRLSSPASAALLQVALLPGEQVTSAEAQVRDGLLEVPLPPGMTRFSWHSSLPLHSPLELTAGDDGSYREIWQLDVDPLWHVVTTGLPPIHRFQQGRWLPQWQPWPGEQLRLAIGRPAASDGQTLTIDHSLLEQRAGQRHSETELRLELRSSQGQDYQLQLPEGAQLLQLQRDGVPQPLQQQGRRVRLELQPGAQQFFLRWQQPQGIGPLSRTPAVSLSQASVNADVHLQLPANRWILLAGGPQLGPAVLFWGMLLLMAGLALVLDRYAPTPLRWWHWLLLGAGLSQTSLLALLPVVLWLVVLGCRERLLPRLPGPLSFNLLQLLLGFLTLLALLTLLLAIQQGLLGLPQMQIAGNGSSAWDLRWYQDRCADVLPQGWALSVPLLVYRLLMLLWALWLALALLRWLRWGWDCFSRQALWRPRPIRRTAAAATPAPAPAERTPAVTAAQLPDNEG